jgi:hypothetical protein
VDHGLVHSANVLVRAVYFANYEICEPVEEKQLRMNESKKASSQ